VLGEFGVNLNDARQLRLRLSSVGAAAVYRQRFPLPPRSNRYSSRLFQIARKLDAAYIEPEHLLLSLTQNTESVAYRVLTNLGVDPAKVRTRIIQELGEAAAVPANGRSKP
jgi:ATP-dependent Clp protease ATP-binding subunit ClpC